MVSLAPTRGSALAAELNELLLRLPSGQYAELKRRIQRAGLLERQPRYYVAKIAATLALGILGLALFLVLRHSWWVLLAAIYAAALYAQFGFLGHDAGHRQIVHSGRVCRALDLLFGPLLVGVSASWWMSKHNRHHSHPNRAGSDPDITLPVVAFSAQRARF